MLKKMLLIFGICSMLITVGCGQKEKPADVPPAETKTEEEPRGEDINAFLHGNNKALIDEFSDQNK